MSQATRRPDRADCGPPRPKRAPSAQESAQPQGDAKVVAQAQTAVTQAHAREAEEYPARGPAIREASDAAERAAQEDGTLTAEKKASIEASRKGADLKDLQAQKVEILAGKICALANSDRDRLDGLER